MATDNSVRTPDVIGKEIATYAIEYALWEIYEDVKDEVDNSVGNKTLGEKNEFIEKILDAMTQKIKDYMFTERKYDE